MRKDPEVFLAHILESIDLIEGYSEGKTREEFVESLQLQDAIIRRIEIIGEAVKNLPEDFKRDHPEIAWQKIAGMRDVLSSVLRSRSRTHLGRHPERHTRSEAEHFQDQRGNEIGDHLFTAGGRPSPSSTPAVLCITQKLPAGGLAYPQDRACSPWTYRASLSIRSFSLGRIDFLVTRSTGRPRRSSKKNFRSM